MGSRQHKSIAIICLISFPFVNLPVVDAAEIRQSVKQIYQDIATGNSSERISKIELSPGYGVNISFIKTGEIVEKVWLDNPAIASLNVDGCLTGLSQQCEQSGATVIHLRQINKLKLPQLPSTNTSLLTVIAKGKLGRQVYLFQVAADKKRSNHHTIEIIPSVKTISEPKSLSIINNTKRLQQVSLGLTIAQQQGRISQNSRLWKRIERFLLSVRSGKSMNIAARNSGISIQLINRLIELGSNNNMQR